MTTTLLEVLKERTTIVAHTGDIDAIGCCPCKETAGAAEDEAPAGADDSGVQAVRAIHARLKEARFRTEVIGASFHNPGRTLALVRLH